MAANSRIKKATSGNKGIYPTPKTVPESLAIARAGVTNASDFARLMGALMGDLLEGSVSADVGYSVSKAGSNLLRVIELQHKFGVVSSDDTRRILQLVDANPKKNTA